MWFYLIRRFNLFILTVAILYFLVFLMLLALPGDLLTNVSGLQQPSVKQVAELTQTYQLDKNWFNQYISFINQRIHGNFGLSFTTGQPIWQEILNLLPATIELCLYASTIALIIGFPLGILAAIQPQKPVDNVILGASLVGYSIPVFWLGVIAIMYFGLELQWLPVAGRLNLLYQVPPITGFTFLDIWLSDLPYKQLAYRDAFAHLIMPTLTLAVIPTTMVVRITRIAVREELNANYIKASQSRGLSPATVIFRHALPNAMQPILSQLSVQLSTLLTSAMVTEVIFSWPGIGTWLIDAIYQRDYPVISAGVLICAGFIILVSVLTDIVLIATTPQRRSAIDGSS